MSTSTNFNPNDIISKLLLKYRDPLKVKTILKGKYKIDIDIMSLTKRLPTYANHYFRSRR